MQGVEEKELVHRSSVFIFVDKTIACLKFRLNFYGNKNDNVTAIAFEI